jgi:hypothetical protein
MQELRQEASVRYKAKSHVGSSKATSLNYSRHIPAFDKSHIPARALSIKSEVKQSTFPDILGTKKQEWNPSVLLDRTKEYHQQVELRQFQFEIRKGLRDVSLPPDSVNPLYEGVDSRNSFAGWNTSVQFSDLEHQKQHVLV